MRTLSQSEHMIQFMDDEYAFFMSAFTPEANCYAHIIPLQYDFNILAKKMGELAEQESAYYSKLNRTSLNLQSHLLGSRWDFTPTELEQKEFVLDTMFLLKDYYYDEPFLDIVRSYDHLKAVHHIHHDTITTHDDQEVPTMDGRIFYALNYPEISLIGYHNHDLVFDDKACKKFGMDLYYEPANDKVEGFRFAAGTMLRFSHGPSKRNATCYDHTKPFAHQADTLDKPLTVPRLIIRAN